MRLFPISLALPKRIRSSHSGLGTAQVSLDKLGLNRRVLLMSGGASLAIAGCEKPDLTFRYRLTVEVQTPEGLRTGSAVRAVGISWQPGLGQPTGYQSGAVGEAVVVDLGSRGKVFVLLRSINDADYDYRIVYDVLPPPPNIAPASPQNVERYRNNHLRAEVPVRFMPQIIRFRDPKDPRTVVPVDPLNLATQFGPGVRLARMVIETTRDPVTSSIANDMPNFGAGSGYAEWLRTLTYSDPRNITKDDLKRGGGHG